MTVSNARGLQTTLTAGAPLGVGLRLLQPNDAPAVQAVFAGLGPQSRWLRFLSGKPALTDADLRQLTSVDGWTHLAVVASTLTSQQPIGIARFVRDRLDAGSAEVALAVVDAWQRRGIGGLLADCLIACAVAVGVRRLTMTVSAENAGVRALLDRSQLEVTRMDLGFGVWEYAVALERPWDDQARRSQPGRSGARPVDAGRPRPTIAPETVDPSAA
ncbi:hypothetical protein GCM10009623_32800 [Nocardioides aestuarii]|uniref:GNAT family N-acetyltransferase n=1 Tax=Nocardioides aestuarii TaxID=252231 RepID=A0ABW4TP64_9ACTN